MPSRHKLEEIKKAEEAVVAQIPQVSTVVDTPRVSNVQDRNARASMMLTQKLLGKSLTEIGEMFSLRPKVVQNELERARKLNLYTAAANVIDERLVPKALAVYDTHLGENDLDAARDIAFGTGILRKDAKSPLDAGGSEITLEILRAKYVVKSPEEPAIDAEVVDEPVG